MRLLEKSLIWKWIIHLITLPPYFRFISAFIVDILLVFISAFHPKTTMVKNIAFRKRRKFSGKKALPSELFELGKFELNCGPGLSD